MIGMRRILAGEQPDPLPGSRKTSDLEPAESGYEAADRRLGSLLLLALLSPALLIIAAAVKLTSRGPVLFRQKRIGEHGTPSPF